MTMGVSFVAHGHPVTLYTYEPVGAVPDRVELRDGRTILPLETIQTNRYANGSYALASNLFRYTLQERGEGLWADIDVVCIRPVQIEGPVIVGWENDASLNGAVLYWEAGLPIAKEAVAAFRPGHIPDWLAPRKRAPARIRQLMGRPVNPRDLPHGTFGPKEVTALVRRHGLARFAQPKEVFYPLAPRDATRAFDASLRFEDVVKPRTLTIHLWNERLDSVKATQADAGSLLDSLFQCYGG